MLFQLDKACLSFQAFLIEIMLYYNIIVRKRQIITMINDNTNLRGTRKKILIFIKLPRMTKNEVKVVTMVIVWNGNSEIGAHLWNDLGNLICSRHFFRPRAVTTLIFFFLRKEQFSVILAQYVLSYHSV